MPALAVGLSMASTHKLVPSNSVEAETNVEKKGVVALPPSLIGMPTNMHSWPCVCVCRTNPPTKVEGGGGRREQIFGLPPFTSGKKKRERDSNGRRMTASQIGMERKAPPSLLSFGCCQSGLLLLLLLPPFGGEARGKSGSSQRFIRHQKKGGT